MSSIEEYLGAARFPLTEDQVEDEEIFPDPARAALLELIRVATVTEFSEAWETISAGTVLAGTQPIVDYFPGLPTEARLHQRVCKFPALFVGRRGSGEFTQVLGQDRVVCPWDITWCLGPLSSGEEHRFNAALNLWFPNLVRIVVTNRRHPAYNGGVTPFGPGGIPLDAVEVQSFDAAELPIGENQILYYGVTVTIQTTEYGGFANPDEGVPFLAGVHRIRVGGKEGLVEGILDIDTTHPRKK